MVDKTSTQMPMETNFSTKVLDDNCISKFICGFCLCSTVSEVTLICYSFDTKV